MEENITTTNEYLQMKESRDMFHHQVVMLNETLRTLKRNKNTAKRNCKKKLQKVKQENTSLKAIIDEVRKYRDILFELHLHLIESNNIFNDKILDKLRELYKNHNVTNKVPKPIDKEK